VGGRDDCGAVEMGWDRRNGRVGGDLARVERSAPELLVGLLRVRDRVAHRPHFETVAREKEVVGAAVGTAEVAARVEVAGPGRVDAAREGCGVWVWFC
jgi:hypothetical protein